MESETSTRSTVVTVARRLTVEGRDSPAVKSAIRSTRTAVERICCRRERSTSDFFKARIRSGASANRNSARGREPGEEAGVVAAEPIDGVHYQDGKGDAQR